MLIFCLLVLMPFGEIGDKITVGADDLIEECTALVAKTMMMMTMMMI